MAGFGNSRYARVGIVGMVELGMARLRYYDCGYLLLSNSTYTTKSYVGPFTQFPYFYLYMALSVLKEIVHLQHGFLTEIAIL